MEVKVLVFRAELPVPNCWPARVFQEYDCSAIEGFGRICYGYFPGLFLCGVRSHDDKALAVITGQT